MNKKTLKTIITFALVGMLMLPIIVNAEEIQRGSCEMTINSAKHPSSSTPANATGDCNGLVFGFYVPSTDTFAINGMVNYDISKSGQTFVIGTPAGKFPQSVLTVYTVKEAPKPTPKPQPTQPKEEPKKETQPTKPKTEPKKETQVTQPKTEPKRESKPNTNTANTQKNDVATKSQSNPNNTANKSELISESKETNKIEEQSQKEKKKEEENSEEELLEKEKDKLLDEKKEIFNQNEVKSVSKKSEKDDVDDNPKWLLYVGVGLPILSLGGVGFWYYKRKVL